MGVEWVFLTVGVAIMYSVKPGPNCTYGAA